MPGLHDKQRGGHNDMNPSAKVTNHRLGRRAAIGLAATLAGANIVQAAVPITACGYIISKPGSYVLAADLNQCPTDGIDITVSQVDLKMNGHIITGSGPIAHMASMLKVQAELAT
jgi:hypothetical protein